MLSLSSDEYSEQQQRQDAVKATATRVSQGIDKHLMMLLNGKLYHHFQIHYHTLRHITVPPTCSLLVSTSSMENLGTVVPRLAINRSSPSLLRVVASTPTSTAATISGRKGCRRSAFLTHSRTNTEALRHPREFAGRLSSQMDVQFVRHPCRAGGQSLVLQAAQRPDDVADVH